MPVFDYKAARQSGYSDDEIVSFLDDQKKKGNDLYIPKSEYEGYDKEPGFFQGVAQEIAKTPLRAATTISMFPEAVKGLAAGVRGDVKKYRESQAKLGEIEKRGVDYGYFGEVKPYETAKEALYGGAALGTYAPIGGGAVKAVGTGLIKGLVKPAFKEGLKLAPVGGAGSFLQAKSEGARTGEAAVSGVLGAGATVIGAPVLGLAGKGIAGTARFVTSPLKTTGRTLESVGSKIQQSVFKPSGRDVKDGFKIETVFDEDLGGNLQDGFTKVEQKLQDLTTKLYQRVKGTQENVDLFDVALKTEKSLGAQKGRTFGEAGRMNRILEELREEIVNVSPKGKVDLGLAQEVKQAAGAKGAWEYRRVDPDASASEKVYSRFYSILKNEIKKVSPKEYDDINKRLSALIPVKNAIIRRIPVDARNQAISLSDTIAIAGAIANPKISGLYFAQKVLKSGRVGEALGKAGRQLLGKKGVADIPDYYPPPQKLLGQGKTGGPRSTLFSGPTINIPQRLQSNIDDASMRGGQQQAFRNQQQAQRSLLDPRTALPAGSPNQSTLNQGRPIAVFSKQTSAEFTGKDVSIGKYSAPKKELDKPRFDKPQNNPVILKTTRGDVTKEYRLKDFADKDGYVYHATSPENIDEIVLSGLKLSKEGYQGRGIYFAPDEASTIGQASYNGATIRVNLNKLDSEHITSADVNGFGNPTEIVYGKEIPSSAIEVKTKSGWKSLVKDKKLGKPPTQAYGGLAGFQQEEDESGKKRLTFRPEYALGGLLGAKAVGKLQSKGLTTKFLEYAKGKTTLSRQEILDFARRPELKKGEADLLLRKLEEFETIVQKKPQVIEFESEIDFDKFDNPRIKKLIVPKYLYHETPSSNTESIKQYGLIPGKERNWEGAGNAIFLSKFPGEFPNIAKVPTVNLRVDTRKLKKLLEVDSDMGGGIDNVAGFSYQYSGKIPLEAIEQKVGGKWVSLTSGSKLPAQEFTDSIRRDLLELKPVKVKEPQYKSVTIEEPIVRGETLQEIRNNRLGDLQKMQSKNYEEVVFESPITTNGSSHYPNSKNYFAHARGDEVVESGKKIWREQEIQSDLLQKDNLNKLIGEVPISIYKTPKEKLLFDLLEKSNTYDDFMMNAVEKGGIKTTEIQEFALNSGVNNMRDLFTKYKSGQLKGTQKINQLSPFTNDRFGERIMRERIKEKASKGYEKYRLPTGETIGKIEGFENPSWMIETGSNRGKYLTKENLKVGDEVMSGDVIQNNNQWIITDILGDGRFRAVPKDSGDFRMVGDELKQQGFKPNGDEFDDVVEERLKETFDLTGKSNPQYRRYSNWGKFLKNKYGGKEVTDLQGNSWVEVDLKSEHGRLPIEAFGVVPLFGLPQKKEKKTLKGRITPR